MYFIDRDKIEETLLYMTHQLELFTKQDKWETEIERAALERIAQTVIESILDTGNAMIDGFIMRDPGSYEDIIDILTDEKVVTEEMSRDLKKVIEYRKMLVQQYVNIDHRQVEDVLRNCIDTLSVFPEKTRDYLIHELGPVSAFKSRGIQK